MINKLIYMYIVNRNKIKCTELCLYRQFHNILFSLFSMSQGGKLNYMYIYSQFGSLYTVAI